MAGYARSTHVGRLENIAQRNRDADRRMRRKLLMLAAIVIVVVLGIGLAMFSDLGKPAMPKRPAATHVDGVMLRK